MPVSTDDLDTKRWLAALQTRGCASITRVRLKHAIAAIDDRVVLKAHLENIEQSVHAIIETMWVLRGRVAFLEDERRFRDARLGKLVQLVEHWETSVPCGDAESIMAAWAQRVKDLAEVIGMPPAPTAATREPTPQ